MASKLTLEMKKKARITLTPRRVVLSGICSGRTSISDEKDIHAASDHLNSASNPTLDHEYRTYRRCNEVCAVAYNKRARVRV